MASLALFAPPATAAEACGFTVQDIKYDFWELAPWEGGNGIGIPNDDYTAMAVTPDPPMTFEFCGDRYETYWLSAKGLICFGPGVFETGDMMNFPDECPSDKDISELPSEKVWPNNAIYGFWANLYPGACGGLKCNFYDIQGPVGDRVLVYEFKDVPFMNDPSFTAPVTFQFKVFEASGCFEVHYQYVGYDGGGEVAAAGYEDATGTEGFTWRFDMPAFVAKEEAWSACPFKAVDDHFNLNEDQDWATLDVLANEGGAEEFWIASHTKPLHGTLTDPVDGEFLYRPGLDFVGTDSFTYTIETGSGKLSTATVGLAVQPVNDPPAFSLAVERIIVGPHEPHQIWPGVGVDVRPGPATAVDEAAQGVWFVASTIGNPSLFASPPTLHRATGPDDATSDGTWGSFAYLRFVHAGGAGYANVCFRPVDSGGKATVTNFVGQQATGKDTGDEACMEILVNSPPVAYFEVQSPVVQPGEPVAFDPCPGPMPNCSHDPDGIIRSYRWDFADGHVTDIESPVHSFATPGEYTVELTLQDDLEARTRYVRTVHVAWQDAPADASPPPGAPLALAGPDRTVLEGTTVQLEGFHQGGRGTVRYEWRQVKGIGVDLEGAGTPNPSFKAPWLPGADPIDLHFSLRVAEGEATSAPDYVVVRVASVRHRPVADAGPSQAASPGQLVQLDGSKSWDPDGDRLTFLWTQVGGPAVQLSDPTQHSPTFIAPVGAATIQFRLRVTDGVGAHQAETSVVVKAQAAVGMAVPGEGGQATIPAAGPEEPKESPWSFAAVALAFIVAAGACVYLAIRGKR